MAVYIRKRLGERLIEEGYLTEEQFQIALEKHQKSKVILRQILIDLGFITEDALMKFMGASLGIPFMEGLLEKVADPQIIQTIPEEICRHNNVMPLFKVMDVLIVAMADPFDVFLIDDLKMITDCSVDGVLAKKDEIVKAIDMFYGSVDGSSEIVKKIVGEAEELVLVNEKKEAESTLNNADVIDAPIIRMVNTIISQAIKKGASDIHIEPDEESLRVRYRIDGILREAMVPPKSLQPAIVSRIKIMASVDISIKRTPQDGRFKVNSDNRDFDVRVSTVPTIYGEKVVMRLLDQTSIKLGLKESGLNQDYYDKFQELIKRPYGIILVTGPTGSGKTTTLYLALQAINTSKMNIITIEDPVEYDLEGINQIAVNVKAGVTFAQGLKSILRQDPDVIMVGEMRDLETADIAVRAALTGHLVFSTLHTNDAPSSIARMVDMGIQPYLVTSSVCCVLAQRLVRMICSDCREMFIMSESEFQDSGLEGAPEDYTFYRGKGCDKCSHTGYVGRTGIFELMIIDKELRSLIQSGKSSDMIRDAAQRAGMKTLWQDGLEKVQQGVTTFEELRRVTYVAEE